MTAVDKGARWLASVQGADGGWGHDGGDASSARPGERLESGGNDVANTAVAALALLQAGRQDEPQVERALSMGRGEITGLLPGIVAGLRNPGVRPGRAAD